MVFSSGLVLTQIDLFLAGQIGSLVAGCLTTGHAIVAKTYSKGDFETAEMEELPELPGEIIPV
jgi:hypothetical protein